MSFWSPKGACEPQPAQRCGTSPTEPEGGISRPGSGPGAGFPAPGTRHGPKPYNLLWFGDIHGPKPYKFTWFDDIHGPKPYKFTWFDDIHGRKPYKFIGCGAMAAPRAEPRPRGRGIPPSGLAGKRPFSSPGRACSGQQCSQKGF